MTWNEVMSCQPPDSLETLLIQVGSAIEATEIAAFRSQPDFLGFQLSLLSHIRPDSSDEKTRAMAVKAFESIILPCLEQAKDGVIEVQKADGTKEAQFCLVVLARGPKAIVGAAAFIVRSPNLDAASVRFKQARRMTCFFEGKGVGS
jgi:hypothetical protein